MVAVTDFDKTGLNVIVLGVVTAGAAEGNGTIYRSLDNSGPLGSISMDTDFVVQTGQSITQIALDADGTVGLYRIWDNPSALDWSTFFANADNADYTLRIQTADSGPYELVRGSQGGHFSNWSISDTTARTALSAITEDDEFIIALAKSTDVDVTPPSLSIGTLSFAVGSTQLRDNVEVTPPSLNIGTLSFAIGSTTIQILDVEVTPPDLSIGTLSFAVGSTEIKEKIVSADFDRTGLQIVVLGVITAGLANSSGTIFLGRSHSNQLGSISMDIDFTTFYFESLTRIALDTDGRVGEYRFWDNESSWRNFFNSAGNADYTLRIQTPSGGPYELVRETRGNDFTNWSTSDTTARTAISAIAEGDSFIIALARENTVEVTPPSLNIGTLNFVVGSTQLRDNFYITPPDLSIGTLSFEIQKLETIFKIVFQEQSIIVSKHFQDLLNRILNYLPTNYSRGQVMKDLYNAIVPEFEALTEYLVTPDVRRNGEDEDIQEEIDAYIENRIGWGFERLIQQFFITGANDFLEKIARLYNTIYETDYIKLRNRILFYSSTHKDNNEYQIVQEFEFIGSNLISEITKDYPNYAISIKLNPAGDKEFLAIARRQFNEIFPAHISVVFVSVSQVSIDNSPIKTLDDGVRYTIG